MNKILLFLVALIVGLIMHASVTPIHSFSGLMSDFPYLTFETTDGAKFSVPTESLSLAINGTTLTVGKQTFTLSNLSKMYFSNTDETTSGIVDELKNEELTEIYDLNGKKVSKEQMRKGVFIVKAKDKTYKLIVR